MAGITRTCLLLGAITAANLALTSSAAAQNINITKDRIQFSDGTQQSTAATTTSARTVTISPTIGDASASGQTLRDAIDAIASASDASAAFPYHVILEPGTFDIGSTELELSEFVHLRGAGMSATTIRGDPDSSSTVAVLRTNGNGVIGGLTVHHTGGAGAYGRGIIAGGESMRFQNVRVLLNGSFTSGATLTALSTAGGCKAVAIDCIFDVEPTSTVQFAIGVIVSNSPSTFTADGLNISIQPSATPTFSAGLYCNASGVVDIQNANIYTSSGTSRYAVFATTTSLLSIRNSLLEAASAGVAVEGSSGGAATPVRVLSSQVIGTRLGSNDIYRNCVDGSFAAIP